MTTISKITKTFLLLSFLLGINNIQAQDGETLFKQNCTACHTVGGGRLVGPDLQGITQKRSEDWLIKFIKSSQTLIKSGDEEAQAIFEEYNEVMMPDQNLSDDEIKSVLTYIESQGGAPESSNPAEEESSETAEKEDTPVEEIASEEEKKQKSVADATEEDVKLGAMLFEGEERFEKGGPTCISCHNITNDDLMPGGMLAKDLTNAYSRLGGEAGISGILTSYPFPAMASSYKGKELTDKEVYALMAFMKSAEENSIYQHATTGNGILMYGGGFGLLVLLAIIYLLWFNRKKKHTKESIFKRQLRAR